MYVLNELNLLYQQMPIIIIHQLHASNENMQPTHYMCDLRLFSANCKDSDDNIALTL